MGVVCAWPCLWPCAVFITDPYHPPPAQLPAAASALYCFCTRNCIWSLVTETKEKCKFTRDEGGAELDTLLFT